jgi:hypothetical protein
LYGIDLYIFEKTCMSVKIIYKPVNKEDKDGFLKE